MTDMPGFSLSGLVKPDASKHAASGTAEQQNRDPKLWGTCLKFEAILLQQMMSAMRKTVPKSGLLPSGFANDVHNSMFDQILAQAGSQRSSLGMASSIYQQLDRLHHIQAQPPAADNTLNMHGHIQGEKHGAN